VTSKILLIENDPAFAARLTEALEASGFDVRTTGDGKEGLDLAGDLRPDAVVLCVELPKMSGYIICGKLKKDDALKSIPLVLTSAEATPETFDKHRQLKGRAEEYLLKPFEPEDLVAKLAALVGLPEPAPLDDDEEEGEVLTLDDDIGVEPPSSELDGLPGFAALDLDSLPDEPALDTGSLEDDALKLLDDAFDGIALDRGVASEPPVSMRAPGRAGDRAIDPAELDAAVASLPDLDAAYEDTPLSALGDEAEEAIDALHFDEPEETDGGMPLATEPPNVFARAAVPFSAAPFAAPPAVDARALAELGDRLERSTERLRAAEDELRTANDDARAADGRARASEERGRAADARAAELAEQLAEVRRRAEALEDELRTSQDAAGRAESLEGELEELRGELVVARGELDGARAEVEKRTADLRKRVAELEAQNAKNEERVLKAYQKIKGDEKVREKARKAVAIALQLLDDAGAGESAEARGKIAI
jgi:CheY-like chemotaxis protein/chaperonin cofactor prefoldin